MSMFDDLSDPLGPPPVDALGAVLVRVRRRRIRNRSGFVVIAVSAVVNKNPFETRRTDSAHLCDRAFHLAALRHREETLVRTAALRIRKRTSAGMSAHDAVLEVQEHVVSAAQAYVDRLVLEWFEARVAKITDEKTRAIHARLGDLHALALLERRAAADT